MIQVECTLIGKVRICLKFLTTTVKAIEVFLKYCID